MSKKEGGEELTVREQRAKQLQNQQNKDNKNSNTETKKLYDIIMQEHYLKQKQKEKAKNKNLQKEDDPSTKPIRNIFKMSRVLVTAKDKFK